MKPPATTQDGTARASFVAAVLVVHQDDPPGVFMLREDAPMTIGRGDSVEVAIEDTSISRAHAKIVWERGVLKIEDLGSRNGTWVRGERIKGAAHVLPGESFQLGTVTASINVGSKIDEATARATWPYPRFVARVEDEVLRARAFHRSVSLLALRPFGGDAPISGWFKSVRALLRAQDPVAAFSERALLVLLPETAVREAQTLALAITDRPHDGVWLAAGVASAPPVGSAHELIGLAWEASHAATREGRVTLGGESSSELRGRSFVLESPLMRELMALVRRLAVLGNPVLVTGETGTGKESIARALHESGPRARHPFLAVNGGAIPAGLLEDVLFGHEKGSFTDAHESTPGVIEQADGGTLFLDEVADLSARAQTALLRVLEANRISRIGGVREIPVDIRVVSATHGDLDEMVKRGEFRADLYHRLSSVTLRVPPLRSRPEDLARLIDVFLQEACDRNGVAMVAIDPDARKALLRHEWPGNVRELRNAIERAVVLCAPMAIHLADVEEHVFGARTRPELPAADGSGKPELKAMLREYEARILADALRAAEGNQTLAAKNLGIPLRTFVHKLTQLGIRVPRRAKK
jgi:two-component system, NtrC family, response regulator AtoC